VPHAALRRAGRACTLQLNAFGKHTATRQFDANVGCAHRLRFDHADTDFELPLIC
jgi:hypothetical protein